MNGLWVPATMDIALVNMPFAETPYPSIALTQLRSVVQQRFGDRVKPRIHYVNHDFAKYFGPGAYALITSLPSTVAGLGDWLFRPVAFPEAEDNSDYYFARYYDGRKDAEEMEMLSRAAEIIEISPESMHNAFDRYFDDKSR